MMIFKKAVPRRTFLQGLGATVALPLLDAMLPAFASAAESASPVRFGVAYVPNGIIMSNFTPATEGAGFEMTPILEPLAPFREKMLVLSGLAHKTALALAGEGAGDHARAAATFLSGVHPKKTEGAGIQAGVTVDQFIAKELGTDTQLTSLELALDSTEVVGSCDGGYSCAYTNTLSWRTPISPMPMENKPRAVFERLFGDSDSTNPQERLARMQRDRSVLDFVTEQVSRMAKDLGPKDRAKLNEYLESIREVERRIQKAEEQASRELPALDRPEGVPATFTEHAKLMADLQTLAWQTDMTRVTTYMMGQESNSRVYNELGFSDAYHPLTHHQKDPNKIEKVIQIDILHTQMLAYLLERLQATPDGEGSLLDHSMIVYGCGISDGNLHTHEELPVLVLGGGNGTIRGGRHIRYANGTPASNLYMALLEKLGMPVASFGDSTGKLAI
jgi:hypothetical protein